MWLRAFNIQPSPHLQQSVLFASTGSSTTMNRMTLSPGYLHLCMATRVPTIRLVTALTLVLGGCRTESSDTKASDGGVQTRIPFDAATDSGPIDRRPDATAQDAGARSGEADASGQAASPATRPMLPADYTLPSATGTLAIEIGLPDSEELDFVASPPGSHIPIAGLGQAGLTARIALRIGSDEPLPPARIQVQLTNLNDLERRPGINNNAELLQTLDCRNDGYCYPVIQRVEVSHLNYLPALEGTVVEVSVTATLDGETEPSGASFSWGYLESVDR